MGGGVTGISMGTSGLLLFLNNEEKENVKAIMLEIKVLL